MYNFKFFQGKHLQRAAETFRNLKIIYLKFFLNILTKKPLCPLCTFIETCRKNIKQKI